MRLRFHRRSLRWAGADFRFEKGADLLDYNHFKIPLLRNLVKRAVRPTA